MAVSNHRFLHPSLAVCFALSLFAASCSSSSDDAGSKGKTCADGFRPTADGSACEPIVPQGDCAAGTMPVFGNADCQSVGWTDCPAGFEADASGWGCREIVPEAACPSGTMPVLGKTQCQPVGWTSCPAGFAPDASGWGCSDVLPADPCTGATRAALGSATCQPVGSCTAAFPPANATLFVDDSFTQVDATHFTSIAAALAKAQDGDVIAVEAGTYPEGMVFTHSVTLVGRCAEQVVLDGAANKTPGVDVESAALKVSVSGVTLHGHLTGVAALNGAHVDVADTVIDSAREMGVFASDAGTSVNVKGSVVRGTVSDAQGDWGYGADAESGATVGFDETELADNSLAGVSAITQGTVTATASVIHRTRPDASGILGHGVHLETGGKATVNGSAIAANGEIGVYVNGNGSEATLTDTVVRDTKPAATGQTGIGVQADTKGKVSLTRCALVGNTFLGLILFDALASADVTDSVVRGTLPLNGTVAGRGLMAEDGAILNISGSAVIDNREYGIVAGGANSALKLSGSLVEGTRRATGARYGWGINVADGAHIDMTGSAIVDNEGCGVAVTGSAATGALQSSIVTKTERAPGVGENDPDYLVTGIAVAEGATADVKSCAVIANRNVGLYATGGDATSSVPTSVTADALLVRGTLAADTVGPGNAAGVLSAYGASVKITSGAMIDNSTVGAIATEPGSTASLANVVVSGSLLNNDGELGRAVVAQSGAAVTLDHAALLGNREIALFVAEQAATANVTRTFIADTQPDAKGETGRGIAVQFGGILNLSQSTILHGHDVGLHVVGTDATATVTDAIIGDVAPQMSDQGYGHGVLVHYQSRLALQRSVVFGNAGVGLAFADSTGSISSTDVASNSIGIHAQDGTTLKEVTKLPDAPVDHEVVVTSSVRFLDNGTRVGAGSLPLPEPGTQVPDQPPPPTP